MRSIQRAFSPRKKPPRKLQEEHSAVMDRCSQIAGFEVQEQNSKVSAFEAMLSAREVPKHMRPQLRHLNENMKNELVKNDRKVSSPSPKKRKAVPIDKEISLKKLAVTHEHEIQMEPKEYAIYIRHQSVNGIDRRKSSSLKRLLRNENIHWVKDFMAAGGYEALCCFISQLFRLQWREERHDLLLADFLHCLKSLHETQDGITKLGKLCHAFMQELVDHFLSSRGVFEFGTRTKIVQILQQFVSSSSASSERVGVLLSLLSDPRQATVTFLQSSVIERPYRRWIGEIVRVTTDVTWMFMNYENEIPVQSTDSESFVEESKSAGFGPHVGGTEWEASAYLEQHLRLINLMLESADNPLRLRQDLFLSGLERILGGKVRKASVTLHPGLHAQLRIWVNRALQDKWPFDTVAKGTGLSAALFQRKTTPSDSIKTTPPPILDFNIPSIREEDDFWTKLL